MTNSQTMASAPAKVLLTGGYLVLDPHYSGLVVSIDARFYATVTTWPLINPQLTISVSSPQFTDGHWTFEWTPKGLVGSDDNLFVKTVLKVTLSLVQSRGQLPGGRLDVLLEADNAYYSQLQVLTSRGLDLSLDSLKSLPLRQTTGKPLSQVHKTGLGSSAALVTSLVGALLSHYSLIHPSDWSHLSTKESDLQLVCNVSQMCHCIAQGKIGSGFDVSAAVYGSHSYTRFSPSLLDPVLADLNGDLIDALASSKWDYKCVPFSLPPGLILQLGDVDSGSNTPKMVSSLLKWRKECPEKALEIWEALDACNQTLEREFMKLSEMCILDATQYHKTLYQCSQVLSEAWPSLPSDVLGLNITSSLCEIKNIFLSIRKHLRDMSNKSGVPIEPPSQTKLLDECMNVPGVLLAGVPGAGGLDAVFCIVLSKESLSSLESFWRSYKFTSVLPLLATATPLGIQFSKT